MRAACAAPPEGETRPATRLLRAAGVAGHALAVWLVARLACPRLAPSTRLALVRRLARQTLALLGVAVTTRGRHPHLRGACLVVANHVSWLDVYALNAVAPATYVAKAEVRRWPLAGGIAAGFDTVFLRRGSARDAWRAKEAIAARLRAGRRVVVFPEGTTSDGADVGRFYPALFQAAVDAGVPVQPVGIRYVGADGTRDDAVAFVGDMTFVASLRRVLRRPALAVELTFGPLVRPAGLCRRELARASRTIIAATLQPPEVERRAA